MPPASPSYVTDTHPFLWYATGNLTKLGSNARAAFDRAEAGETVFVVPSIVLAETMYIAEKGRASVKLETLFEKLKTATNYRVYPLDLAIVAEASGLKKLTEIHDRIIVATARYLDLELISQDREIRESSYATTLW